MINGRIFGGVVSFNPDVDLLLENLRAIAPQVERLIVFDNGSANIGAIRLALGDFGDVTLLSNEENVGIARALNSIAEAASDGGAKWLITLDQDSVSAPNMVEVLTNVADSSTPLVTPFIVDRNKLSFEQYQNLNLPDVQYFRRAASKGAITSGALLSLDVLRELGGFDETFFIDYVDYDLNMRLMKAGYRIARANRTFLLHQVGDASATWLRTPRRSLDGVWYWERFYSFGHSPFRCYYKVRNRVLYSKKHWRTIGFSNEGAAQIPQQVLLTLLFEKDRWGKARAFGRGLRDGLRTPVR